MCSLDPNLFLYPFNDGSMDSLGGNDHVVVQETGYFLDAPSHLYKRSCPSVGPSIGWSRVIFEGEKYAY